MIAQGGLNLVVEIVAGGHAFVAGLGEHSGGLLGCLHRCGGFHRFGDFLHLNLIVRVHGFSFIGDFSLHGCVGFGFAFRRCHTLNGRRLECGGLDKRNFTE